MEGRTLNSAVATMFKQMVKKEFIDLYHAEGAFVFGCLMTLMFKTLGYLE
jgi:predicted transcriptional regulator